MIVGITGLICAGKGEIAHILEEKGFIRLSLADEIREVLQSAGIETTRENLQDFGDKMRKQNGPGFWAQRLMGKLEGRKNYVIEGIRNPIEITVFRNLSDFVLVGVKASPEIRFQRMKARNREKDPKTYEEFLAIDAKDRGIDQPQYGQHNAACYKLIDYEILNEGTPEELKKRIEQWLVLNSKFQR